VVETEGEKAKSEVQMARVGDAMEGRAEMAAEVRVGIGKTAA
jgi:hypothetical protein